MSSEIYRIRTAFNQVLLKFSFIVPTSVKLGVGEGEMHDLLVSILSQHTACNTALRGPVQIESWQFMLFQ